MYIFQKHNLHSGPPDDEQLFVRNTATTQTTWLAVTLHSSPATTQTILGCQAVFHWMRTIAFVLYALRPCFSHLMYYLLQESSCILLKIKCHSFQAFWGYFICLLFIHLLLLKYHSPLWTLAYNTALFQSF